MTQKTFYVLTSDELDELINDNFPHLNYEFVADREASNGARYMYNVRESEEDDSRIEEIYNGVDVESVYLDEYLEILAKKRVIKTGDYLIEVSW